MLRSKLPALALAVGLPLTLAAGRAAADWLVLDDGSRLETRGPWEVRGKLVVFTTADGRLSSIRLGDVDLDASREATEAAARQPVPRPAGTPERKPREVVFVLTDADVAHGQEASAAAAPDPTQGTAAEAGPAPAAERLVVTQWQEGTMPDENGLRLSGTLQNRGGNAATRVRLTALVFDGEGSLIATGEAQLSTDVLMPDRQARFQVDLPGVFDFAAVRFDPTSLDFEAGSPEGVEPESGPGEAATGPEPPTG